MYHLRWGSIQEIVQDNIAKSLVRIIPIIRITPANTNNLSHFPKLGDTCQGHLWRLLLVDLHSSIQKHLVPPEANVFFLQNYQNVRIPTSSLSELATSTFLDFFFFFLAFFPVWLPVSLNIKQVNLVLDPKEKSLLLHFVLKWCPLPLSCMFR